MTTRLNTKGERLCDHRGRCTQVATHSDPEVPFDFMLCARHYHEMMLRRDECEASWRAAVRKYG